MDEVTRNNVHENIRSSKISAGGKVLLAITGGTGIILTFFSIPFILPAFRKFCLPFVPATTEQVHNVLKSLKKRDGNLLDVGSGDGRIVIEAAKNGFQAHGVELNLPLIQYSRISALCNGVYRNTSFIRRDLWELNLKPYNNIVIFGVEQMMEHFEKKVLKEVVDETVVVACRFPLPNLKYTAVNGTGMNTVWTYVINSNNIETTKTIKGK